MSSRSIFQSFQSKQGLPVSRPVSGGGGDSDLDGGMRRRLSSLSSKIQGEQQRPMSYIFQRSKSMSWMGAELAGRWWGWGWDWILSKKPSFAADLEMNDQEMAALGSHSRGTFKHVFFKLKSEVGKLLRGSSHNMVLPQSVRPSSSSSSSYY